MFTTTLYCLRADSISRRRASVVAASREASVWCLSELRPLRQSIHPVACIVCRRAAHASLRCGALGTERRGAAAYRSSSSSWAPHCVLARMALGMRAHAPPCARATPAGWPVARGRRAPPSQRVVEHTLCLASTPSPAGPMGQLRPRDVSDTLDVDPFSPVSSFCSTTLQAVSPTDTLRAVLPMFKTFTGLPVVDASGLPVGVISDKDVALFMKSGSGDAALDTAVSSVMSAPAVTIREDSPLAYAAGKMLQFKVHRLVVRCQMQRDGFCFVTDTALRSGGRPRGQGCRHADADGCVPASSAGCPQV